MPRVKTIRNPTPTQTRRLVRQAIIICGSKRGAPYRSIKKYVNANTTEPYVADVTIKNALRFGIHEGSYVQDGAFFKLKLKRLGFEPGPATLGLSGRHPLFRTLRHTHIILPANANRGSEEPSRLAEDDQMRNPDRNVRVRVANHKICLLG